MTTTRQLTRAEVLALPPVITLADLAEALGVSEPTIREVHRKGELQQLGIRVNRLGAQWRVVTASVWEYLGLADGTITALSASRGAGQGRVSGHALRAVRSAAGSTGDE